MSFIDVGIPGVIGLVLLLWPQAVFAEAAPDPGKVLAARIVGALLIVAAGIHLTVRTALA